MLKILFLVTQSEFGGAQRYIFEIARNLDPRKYQILVTAGEGDGELFRKCQMSNVKCQKLNYLKRVPNPLSIIFAIVEIFNILKEKKPDIFFLSSTTAGLLGSLAAKIYKIQHPNSQLRTIYRIGGWAFRDPRFSWLNQIIFWSEKLTAPFKDKIIVNSEIDRELAVKYKITPPEKIVKIYNGINPQNLDFLSKEEGHQKILELIPSSSHLKSEAYLVGTVANFYKTKGLKYLIEAASLLKNRAETVFIVIGDGKERPELEALIKRNGLENNFFLVGRIPDAYRYLKAFDIFVLPSLKEGFSWIILEAMAAELPIVASKTGALPEMIKDGINGFLVEPKNSQALAEKITWLLTHFQEAKNMGFLARKKVEKEFSLGKMLEETEKIYQSLILF